MDYNSKYTGEQVEELLDKINASPEDVATPSGNYPDMTVGKASQADTAARAINADNATKAASATTADRATQATTADKATTADYATTAGQATTAESAKTATNADRATTAGYATTAGVAESAEHAATASLATKATTADKASTADSATHADSADSATIANSAMKAEYATNAENAERATIANSAESAKSAASASTAALAINLQNAPELTTSNEQIVVKVGNKTSNPLTVPYAQRADFATDLSGRVEATPEEFTLRPSAGNISIRDDSATIKRIKGNSIVWNQMCDFTNGVFTFGVSSGIKDAEGYTITTNESNTTNAIFQFSSSIPFYSHKWLAIATIKSPIKVNIKGMSTQGFVPNTKCDIYSFFQSSEGNWYWGLSIESESIGTISEIKVYNYLLFDLTQMFGAGNEPDTVEEFKALFPGNHYEYNPGQLVSMTANGLFTNGFNQWDEEWEVGYLNADGTTAGYVQNYIRAKNYIPVISGEKYYAKLPNGVSDAQLYVVDENYNLIKQIFPWINNRFVIPDGAAYIRFYLKYGSEIYNNDICINLSHTGVENGKYEPYWDATKDLSIIQKYFPNGMRSAGSIYDEISFDETTQKWVAIQRVGNVDLGELEWIKDDRPNSTITWRFKTGIINNANQSGAILNILSSKYTTDISPIGQENVDNTIIMYNGRIYIEDTSYTDVATLKQALSGVILNYELAEPIITVIEEPINLSYKVGDFGIEQILSDSFSAPFRADIIYQFNATDRIRENSLNIEKLSKTQKDYLPLTGGTVSGQINSQDIKPVEDSTYQLGDSTHKYKNVFSDFFTGNLEGNAKTATDLTGRVEDTPEVFTYRPSAGEKSIKDDNAFIRRVKGNSVVWNQMISTPPVVPYTNRCDLSMSGNDINATVNSIEYSYVGFYYSLPDDRHPKTVNGHTYFISGLFSCPKQSTVSFGVGSSSIKQLVSANTLYSYNTIQKQTSDTVGAIFTCWIEDIQVGDTFKVQNWNVIDLTAMFGAGNEPTTVEEFRALYPDSYYPYNAGELRNLVCSGIKTVGFNQWDEQWEVGSINQDGGDTPSTTMFRSVGYMQILQQKYCVKQKEGQVLGFRFYDENKVHISGGNRGVVETITTLIPPPNASYMRFVCTTSNTYNNDICINLHHTGYRDGEYEPYKEVTHSLPLSQITNGEPLRKAGSVYDEINETEYIKRVGVVDLGSLNWSIYTPTSDVYFADIPTLGFAKDFISISNLFSTKFTPAWLQDVLNDAEQNNIYSSHTKCNTLYVRASGYDNEHSFKSAMSGVMLNYELAEPIVTPIETPLNLDYQVEDFGTEEAILAENSAPFSADIVYQFNATDQIRNNTRNINKLQKSAFTPSGTSAQYIRGDGSYGDRFELSQSTPINDGEYEMPDAIHQFILTPNYYAKSPVNLDNSTTVTVCVTPPEDSNYLAEYWFEFAVDETLPNIEYYQPNNSKAVFRIDGDMMTYAVNILHLISSDGGITFFGEIRSYSL